MKSKQKGNRVELELAKLLSERLGASFSRSIGSGNRWSQVELAPNSLETLCGDLAVPQGFRWVIECKGGYDAVDLARLVAGGASPVVDGFIAQVLHDVGVSGRLPMVCWKRYRTDWIAMVRVADLDETVEGLRYGSWILTSLDRLVLTRSRGFWFCES